MKIPVKSYKIIYGTVQKAVTCHPQLDWGSHNLLHTIKLRDSLFTRSARERSSRDDKKDTFWTPSFNINFYEK